MTELLYLTSVTLKNYRSFGDKTIPLQPGPSVLVVAGPNGLGKTSLIEGTEWALTGRFRRFDEKRQDEVLQAVARRVDGKTVGEPSVTLSFSNGISLSRETLRRLVMTTEGDGGWPFDEPDDLDRRVIQLLKDPAWSRPIHDLSAYLGLTHFLSQSPTMRLMSRNSAERWADLSGLTGAARIDRMLGRLAQSKRTQATNYINRLRNQHEAVSRQRENLESLLEQVREQEALLRAQAAMPPAQVLTEARRLAERLKELSGIVVKLPDDAPDAVAELAAAAIKAMKVHDDRWMQLTSLSSLPAKWTDLNEALNRLRNDHAALQQAEFRAAAVESALARRDCLKERRRLLDHEALCAAGLEKAARAVSRADQASKEAEENLAAAKLAIETWAKLAEAARQERAVLDEWRALADQAARVRQAFRVIREQEPARLIAERAFTAADDRLKESQAARDAADRALADAEQAAEAAAAAVNEKAHHLQALIHALHEDETECPLCLTHKEKEPGWVLAKAREAVSRQDPALKAANGRLSEARLVLAECQDDVAEQQRSAQAARDRLAPFQQRVQDAEEARQALYADARIAAVPFESLTDWLAAKVAASEKEVTRLQAERDRADPEGTVADSHTRAEHTAAERRRELAEAREWFNAAEREHAAAFADLKVSSEGAGNLDAAATDAAIITAEKDLREAEAEARKGLAELRSDLRGDHDALMSDPWKLLTVRLSREMLGKEDELQAAWQRWQAVGLPGDPSQVALSAVEHRVKEAKSEVAKVQSECHALGKALQAWAADIRMSSLQKEVASIVHVEDAVDVAGCLAAYDQRSQKLLAELEKWQRARDLMGKVYNKVESEQAAFCTSIVEPLTKRSTAFDAMWSSFPELQASLQARQQRGTAHLDCTVGGVNADLLFSEGQAGGKALSFLLAASTAYPWSRWRALLLDDPLQYNDLVHKAAFLDLLRPLVRDLGYQVVMSTHDLEEARFIQRKCRNAGIAFQLCRLTSIERDGVQFDMT